MTTVPMNPTLTIQNMTNGFLLVSIDHQLSDQQSMIFTILIQKTPGLTLDQMQLQVISQVAKILSDMQAKLGKQ